jgi:hypothetical protein
MKKAGIGEIMIDETRTEPKLPLILEEVCANFTRIGKAT